MNLIASETAPSPGFYRMSAPAYFGDPTPTPSLTQSMAKLLLERSPAHAYAAHPKLGGSLDDAESYDKVKAIGNAAHAMLIGRGKDLALAEFDAWRTKEAKAFKADALAAGKVPILAEHYAHATQIVIHVRDELDRAGLDHLFNPAAGEGEVCAVWQEDGLWFRTLIDWLSNDMSFEATDLKTTAMSVAPHVLPRLAADAGWDIQAAMHERALDTLDPDGRGRRMFRFVAVEQEPPFAMTVVEMSEHWMHMGRRKLATAMAIWRKAMESGDWPAYPLAPVMLEYPGWAESRWLDREVSEFADLDAPHGRDKTGRPMSILEAG